MAYHTVKNLTQIHNYFGPISA